MAKVTIEGHGDYTLGPDKIQELVQWLTLNEAAKIVPDDPSSYDGKQLLNETGQPKPRDPAQPPKGDPNKTWDFGTPWA